MMITASRVSYSTSSSLIDNSASNMKDEETEDDDIMSAAVEAVRRCLFGPTDGQKTRAGLQVLRRQLDSASCKRWNFDFQAGRPLPIAGQYAWVELNSPKLTRTTGTPKCRLGTPGKKKRAGVTRLSLYSDALDSTVNRRLSSGSSNIAACWSPARSTSTKFTECLREPLRPCSPVELRLNCPAPLQPQETANVQRRHSCIGMASCDKQVNQCDMKKLSPTIERRRKCRPSSIIDYFPSRKSCQLLELKSKRRL